MPYKSKKHTYRKSKNIKKSKLRRGGNRVLKSKKKNIARYQRGGGSGFLGKAFKKVFGKSTREPVKEGSQTKTSPPRTLTPAEEADLINIIINAQTKLIQKGSERVNSVLQKKSLPQFYSSIGSIEPKLVDAENKNTSGFLEVTADAIDPIDIRLIIDKEEKFVEQITTKLKTIKSDQPECTDLETLFPSKNDIYTLDLLPNDVEKQYIKTPTEMESLLGTADTDSDPVLMGLIASSRLDNSGSGFYIRYVKATGETTGCLNRIQIGTKSNKLPTRSDSKMLQFLPFNSHPLVLINTPDSTSRFFKTSKPLGQGAFGIVVNGLQIEGNFNSIKRVAIKTIQTPTPEAIAEFEKEKEKMEQLTGQPNVVQLLGSDIDEKSIITNYLVVSYCSLGSLDNFIKEPNTSFQETPRKLRRQYYKQILLDAATGLQFVHTRNLVHCDFAARNVLLHLEGDGLVAKVADFGLTKSINEELLDPEKPMKIPILWMHPDIYLDNEQLKAYHDYCSYMVMLSEVIHGKCILTRPDLKPTALQLKRTFYEKPSYNYTPPAAALASTGASTGATPEYSEVPLSKVQESELSGDYLSLLFGIGVKGIPDNFIKVCTGKDKDTDTTIREVFDIIVRLSNEKADFIGKISGILDLLNFENLDTTTPAEAPTEPSGAPKPPVTVYQLSESEYEYELELKLTDTNVSSATAEPVVEEKVAVEKAETKSADTKNISSFKAQVDELIKQIEYKKQRSIILQSKIDNLKHINTLQTSKNPTNKNGDIVCMLREVQLLNDEIVVIKMFDIPRLEKKKLQLIKEILLLLQPRIQEEIQEEIDESAIPPEPAFRIPRICLTEGEPVEYSLAQSGGASAGTEIVMPYGIKDPSLYDIPPFFGSQYESFENPNKTDLLKLAKNVKNLGITEEVKDISIDTSPIEKLQSKLDLSSLTKSLNSFNTKFEELCINIFTSIKSQLNMYIALPIIRYLKTIETQLTNEQKADLQEIFMRTGQASVTPAYQSVSGQAQKVAGSSGGGRKKKKSKKKRQEFKKTN